MCVFNSDCSPLVHAAIAAVVSSLFLEPTQGLGFGCFPRLSPDGSTPYLLRGFVFNRPWSHYNCGSALQLALILLCFFYFCFSYQLLSVCALACHFVHEVFSLRNCFNFNGTTFISCCCCCFLPHGSSPHPLILKFIHLFLRAYERERENPKETLYPAQCGSRYGARCHDWEITTWA